MKRIIWIAIWVLLTVQLQAQLHLPRFFSDHMVLQRHKPVTVWGWDTPGSTVCVILGGNQERVEANAVGEWRVELKPLQAGGPYDMEIVGQHEQIILHDILIGDVWLCGGQSNMEFALKDALGADTTIARAGNPWIRLLTVPKTVQFTEQNDIAGGQWEECTPATVPVFSAVGYYFGKYLQEDLQVPVGLIHTSWGGTDIRTWTSWTTMLKTDELKSYQGKSVNDLVNDIHKKQQHYFDALQNDPGMEGKWYQNDTQLNEWENTTVPQASGNILDREDGIVWYVKSFDLPGDATGKESVLHLGPVDDEDITYINGIQVGSVADWSSPRQYTVPQGILKKGENRLTVKCKDNNGGGGLTGTSNQYYLEVGEQTFQLDGQWKIKPSVLTSMFQHRSVADCNIASVLYNGMVHPLVGYPVKGVIWYQGESNDFEAYRYRALFPAMITDWRTLWGYDFPFIWVQLANYKAVKEHPDESQWAELREAQNMTLALPHTGQAVITDIGDAHDIHPRNKGDVGFRLYRNALEVAYDRKVIGAGPVYKSMKIKGNQIILTFSNIGEGLAAKDGNPDGLLKGFTIAGEDRRFVPASARIQGKQVIVTSEQVTRPVAVRYGWADNPCDADLVNSARLLASPFRTDSWKGITE